MAEQQQCQTTALRAVYEKLVASKQAERQLEAVKDLIIAAPAEGISDKELIRAIKKAYPAITLTPTKLKQLRDKWAAEASSTSPALIENVELDLQARGA